MGDRLNTEEVAAFIPAPINTVRYWRHIGQGPRSYKIGRRVMYDRADVEAWLAEQKSAASA
jgi:predicted DNA-binding transcriptional regulator AlpA